MTWSFERSRRGASAALWVTCVTLGVSLGALSCGPKDRAYEARAKIVRTVTNRKDAAGNAAVVDVELAFGSCPGEVRKLIRGGGEFAPCMTKLATGTEVSVKLVSAMRRNGHRSARVVEVGGCKREPDPTDSRSYGTIRLCEKTETDGIVVGFKCEAQPTPAMLAACPWLEQ